MGTGATRYSMLLHALFTVKLDNPRKLSPATTARATDRNQSDFMSDFGGWMETTGAGYRK